MPSAVITMIDFRLHSRDSLRLVNLKVSISVLRTATNAKELAPAFSQRLVNVVYTGRRLSRP